MKASVVSCAVLLPLTAWAGARQNKDRRRHRLARLFKARPCVCPGKVLGPAGERGLHFTCSWEDGDQPLLRGSGNVEAATCPGQRVPSAGMLQLSTRGRLCPGQCPPRRRLSWHQGSGSHVSGLSRPLPGSPEGQAHLCPRPGPRPGPSALLWHKVGHGGAVPSPLLSCVCGSSALSSSCRTVTPGF